MHFILPVLDESEWLPSVLNRNQVNKRIYVLCHIVGVDVAWELAWLDRLRKTVSVTEQATGKDS